jgi:hypothetical protein
MIHIDPTSSNPKPELKQVEFNTIASSFGGLSARVSALHRYVKPALLTELLLIPPATFITVPPTAYRPQ